MVITEGDIQNLVMVEIQGTDKFKNFKKSDENIN